MFEMPLNQENKQSTMLSCQKEKTFSPKYGAGFLKVIKHCYR